MEKWKILFRFFFSLNADNKENIALGCWLLETYNNFIHNIANDARVFIGKINWILILGMMCGAFSHRFNGANCDGEMIETLIRLLDVNSSNLRGVYSIFGEIFKAFVAIRTFYGSLVRSWAHFAFFNVFWLRNQSSRPPPTKAIIKHPKIPLKSSKLMCCVHSNRINQFNEFIIGGNT